MQLYLLQASLVSYRVQKRLRQLCTSVAGQTLQYQYYHASSGMFADSASVCG